MLVQKKEKLRGHPLWAPGEMDGNGSLVQGWWTPLERLYLF